MTVTEPQLAVEEIGAGYSRGDEILRSVTLHVRPREVVAVVGPNGAGKTTLLRCIAGALRIRSGSISVAGRVLPAGRPDRAVSAGIGYSPEGRQLFPDMSVRENLLLGTFSVRRSRRRAVAAAGIEHAVGVFPILGERLNLPAGSLSGGQQQMLALGRALMMSPEILLLDEPSLGLSPVAAQAIFAALASLASEGLAVLLVEQQTARALDLAARAYVLRGGEIRDSASAEVLADDPERLMRAYFGSAYGRDVTADAT